MKNHDKISFIGNQPFICLYNPPKEAIHFFSCNAEETQERIFSNLKLLKPHIYNNLMTFIYLLRNKKSFPIELIHPSVSSVHSGIKGLCDSSSKLLPVMSTL